MTEDWNFDMDSAPSDGTPVMLWDGIDVCEAAYESETSYEDFLTFCDPGEGRDEYEQYIEENPPRGWVSHEPITGDETLHLTPIAWAHKPKPPESNRKVDA